MKKMLVVLAIISILATTSLAQKRKSDSEDEGYKGPVKKVVTEGAKLTDKLEKAGAGERKIYTVESYDTNGDLIEKEIHSIGEKHVYTYIGGEKTVRIHRTRTDGPPPIMISGPVAGAKNSKRRNSRYDYKFAHKFDADGNRTEWAWYHNDGSLWLRYVSTFDAKGNKTKYAQYRSDGTLGFEVIYKYDGKGHVIEETWDYPNSDRYDHSTNFTYEEFDEKGNWVRRKSYNVVVKDGKRSVEPLGIIYRTITYY